MKKVSFFENSNKDECAMKSCQIFNSDCKTLYDGGNNAPVVMDYTKN